MTRTMSNTELMLNLCSLSFLVGSLEVLNNAFGENDIVLLVLCLLKSPALSPLVLDQFVPVFPVKNRSS